MELFNLKGILSAKNHVVIELIPQGRSCELGAWKLRKRAKIYAVYGPGTDKEDIDAYGPYERAQEKI
jgi:hypothetical protein